MARVNSPCNGALKKNVEWTEYTPEPTEQQNTTIIKQNSQHSTNGL
jgi:hypothetical protein